MFKLLFHRLKAERIVSVTNKMIIIVVLHLKAALSLKYWNQTHIIHSSILFFFFFT